MSIVVCAARKLGRVENPAWVTQDLPWRTNRTPYRILLAELLLIRTRADVVADIFEGVVARYPDLESIARTNEAELRNALRPLGLKKRVPLLIRTAVYIVEELEGRIPTDREELIKIPGIGAYTSAAVAAFAFDEPIVPADVNVLRFLSRLTGLEMEHKTKGSKELRTLLPLLRKDRGGPTPEVLLDFTRTVCRPRAPQCEDCPLTALCAYYHSVFTVENG